MEITGGLWADVLIVLTLLVYVFTHIKDGVFKLVSRLTAFILGAYLSFVFYAQLSEFASAYIEMSQGILDAVSFIVLFVCLQFLIGLILGYLTSFIPERYQEAFPSRALASIPAFIDGLILIALTLLLLVTIPFFPAIKSPIESSVIGSVLIERASDIQTHATKVFGGAAREIQFLTVKPGEGESVELPFKPRKTSIDIEAEVAMLELVNRERAKVGAGALRMDDTIVPVAREHSLDMWQRQYFAHENPDGESPFDRMDRHGVQFIGAGENLALARTVEQAHIGLMNSPGHKRNILDPAFTRVGIGVIDGGIYGKMFTQNFAY